MSADIRILLLADSHLGLDLPAQPRVHRRRRGHDFLANYAAALEPARRGEVDLVVHGGDVFDTPDVGASVAYQGLEPLRRVAEAGVPVFVVPGNHERSRLPHGHLASHPLLHVFDRPRTFTLEVRGRWLALAGFPFARQVRGRFLELVEETGWRAAGADAALLCIHQCVEGATVGPADFVFRNAADVVRGREIPAGFAAVLSGHIHRQQVLTADLSGAPLAAPVLYPGSIERTALAEMGEKKGYMLVTVTATGAAPASGVVEATVATPATPAPWASSGARASWEFRELPVRPMLVQELARNGQGAGWLDAAVREIVAGVPADAVLTIRIAGELSDRDRQVLSAANLRSFVPDSMNVSIRSDATPFVPRRREREQVAEEPGLF